MKRILLIGAPISGNFGGPSILNSVIKVLEKFIPDADFTLLSPITGNYKFNETYAIKIVRYKSTIGNFMSCAVGAIFHRGSLNIPFISNNKILKEFESADVIIDIWGIIFTDSLNNGLLNSAMVGKHLLIGKLLNKPVIKYTADMGPFMKRCNRFFAKFYLNKIDLILARGKETNNYLVELGITTPILVCPDTAFLLEVCPNKKIFELFPQEKIKRRNIIGISVSHMSEQRGDGARYSIVMAQIADYLIQTLDAFIVLIPNEIFHNRYDDVDVAKKIFKKMRNKEETLLIMDELPADELKGIIGKCELMIGCRYHSIVASISMGIPTLALGWHHKYQQIMDLVGQEKYVCNVKNLTFLILQRKVDDLWENRNNIKDGIKSKLPYIKEKILIGGEKTKDVIEQYKK